MNASPLSTVTHEVIAAYGNTAKNVINAYRAGGERVVGFLEQRWESALEQSSPQLSAEVQANARHAQKVVGSYYARGLELGTASADAVVDQFVKLAGQGVSQVAANASLFEEKTGITALSKLSVVAAPAVATVGRIASQLEEKSGALASRIAGGEDFARSFANSVRSASPFRKARKASARKAA